MFTSIWAFLLSQFASCNFLTYPIKEG